MFNKKKLTNYPTHIAFIMDGNRRWATEKGLNKMFGHRQGAVALKNLLLELSKIPQIKYASFFAFSTENWKRSSEEIDYLFNVVYDFVDETEQLFDETNIKLVCMGDLSKFPQKMKDIMTRAMEKTKNNDGLVVYVAMNYGGRDDIVHAVNKVLEENLPVTENNILNHLYSAPAPDIDFLIRTSGEMRVSNFMLFQMAYSELYFTKTFWPDFDKKELYKALIEFSKRNRRFGGK